MLLYSDHANGIRKWPANIMILFIAPLSKIIKFTIVYYAPPTTMIKLVRINSAGALAACFTLPFIEYPFTPSVFPLLPRDVSAFSVFLDLFQRVSVPSVFLFVFLQTSVLFVSLFAFPTSPGPSVFLLLFPVV